ncbi:MAG: tRNA lysidine(34) synthetase TilS [Clostridia bacterium]|nr:tRNA lysidine(34) synthetase TilS [Clostridia bacterium]MBQ7380369.1 tRNA lysidine(34) synthetase TilS [Clostridia bacterium]
MDKFTLSLPDTYQKDTPVLVAFSGGADSMLLLHLLHKQAKQCGSALYAVHVHHGIRGAEADADLDFCRKTCRQLKIPLFAVKVNVPALAKKTGQSLEEAARHARYRHFARLMRKHHIPLLATAHHADDNLETLLFRLCRGTGTQGLRGIPAYAPLPGTDVDDNLCLFRPLLHLTKQEILDACGQMHLSYVTDATNSCDDYARNRIRNRVIPELEILFPHPQHAAARLCRAANEDCEALDGIANALYCEHAAAHTLPIALLRTQPAAIGKRLIMRLYGDYAKECGQEQHMAEAVHLDAIYAQICQNTHGSISLPGSIAAVTDRHALRMTQDQKRSSPPAYLLPLQQGFTEIAEAGVAIWATFPENQKTDTRIDTNVNNLYTELQVRFDTIKGQVFLRPIRQGDVILHGGMHKKIRKLYGRAGVPLALRPRLPLLCDEDGVLAVPGICIRDGAEVKAAEKSLNVHICLQNHFDT